MISWHTLPHANSYRFGLSIYTYLQENFTKNWVWTGFALEFILSRQTLHPRLRREWEMIKVATWQLHTTAVNWKSGNKSCMIMYYLNVKIVCSRGIILHFLIQALFFGILVDMRNFTCTANLSFNFNYVSVLKYFSR